LAISAICSREFGCPKWKLVAQAVADLNAASTSYVDEHDFEKMLPVLNGLGGDNQSQGSWLALSTDERNELQQMTNESKTFDGTRMLLPLIYTCFHMLYDPDGVISRSSNKALKCLVTTCSESALSNMDGKVDLHQNRWVKLIETTVVPCLKIGITTKHLATRRIFILLLSHVARHFVGCNSVHLYGDLRCLIRDDDQELDFFLNVTHVQLHRRARAFNRLRKVLCAHAGQLPLFSDQSFGNILLPLAMHPVYECNSKDEESYVIEAIATVGEISKHLPWSKYNSTLQSVLNNLGRYPDQERFLIAMLCAIIDAFHFSVETGEDTSVYKEDQAQQSSQGNGVSHTQT
jgi:U3 small nucleolar RNA-associated protein 20